MPGRGKGSKRKGRCECATPQCGSGCGDREVTVVSGYCQGAVRDCQERVLLAAIFPVRALAADSRAAS